MKPNAGTATTLNPTLFYTFKTPEPGRAIAVLPRYGDRVRSTGRIETASPQGSAGGLEIYTVVTGPGEKLRVAVLEPDSRMDAEAERCYLLLSWHRPAPLYRQED